MRLLFLNAYFIPEIIAFSHLEKDLIAGLLKEGHRIDVLCPTPTRGITQEQAKVYARKKEETLFDGGVQVKRFLAPREGKNPLLRALRYFWCNYRQLRLGGAYRDTELIFAVSTPPTQGLLAGMLKKRLQKKTGRRIPFVYCLQDVFPDSLVTTNLARKESLLYRMGRKLEDRTYRQADAIIVISESIKQNLLEKGVPEEKITVISNWIDTNRVRPVSKEENTLFEAFSIDRAKFTVVYAGNLGEAQGAGVILDAAKLLPQIQFVIFGGGAGYEEAARRAKTIPNVIINGLQPQSRVPEVYSLGDIGLITCKKGVGTSGMPSKTWSIMACATPIVAAFDQGSELDRILTDAKAGVCVAPENPQALAEAILACRENLDAYSGGRAFVCENASAEVCVAKYLQTMTRVMQ